MVERRDRRRARLLRLAPLAAAAAMLLASEAHAEWRVVPAVTLTERYTDNFWLESNAQKRSNVISELTPSLALTGTGQRLTLNGTAQWRNFDYRDDKLRNTLDHSFEYALAGRGTLADEFLYVDASATRTPRNISAFGPRVDDVPYLDANRTRIETWRISPYLERRFGQDASLTVRYARDRVSGSDVAGYAATSGDSVSANLVSGSAFSKLGWSLAHVRQQLEDSINGETSTQTTVGNLRYALTARLALTASAGYDRYDFDRLGGDTAGRNWSLGVDWTPSLRTRVNAALGRHFYGQTGKFSLVHRSRRTVWNLGYDDIVTTSREQFLLPAAIDTAAMLDQLFSTTIIDPAARRQAVDAYIRINGLPPSLADNVNFLSNRYFRQKGFHGSMAFKLPRTSGVVSLYDNDRIALSNQQSDSTLLGSQRRGLNDNIRQRGANASVNYRLNPRTSAVASASWSRSRSVTTDFDDLRRDFRIGLSRELGRHARATLDVRRSAGTRGIFGPTASPYHEHSISASVSAEL